MQNKTWCIAAFLAMSILQNLAWSSAAAKTPSYFTAAVFESTQLTQECPSDAKEAKKTMKFNVDFFSQVATIAKSKGADVIVFPEYGLYPECNRAQTRLFCELVPDPEEKANPCVEAERFSESPSLRTLSCMARNNSMVVQANMAEYLPCKGEPGCPNGHLQFNTNVVFDRSGALISRYRKEHLFHESHFDKPREKQNPKFTVDFGTFLSYVYYDLIEERIVEEMTEDVDGVFFSTMWENTMPLAMTVQFFQSFAITMNTTLLAACIQLPRGWAVGSGIFSGPYGALSYTFDPDGLNKLVVARVPRRNHVLEDPKSSTTVVYFNGTTSDWESDGENVGKDGSDLIVRKFTTHHNTTASHYHVMNMENYTLHQITQPSASIEECNNGLCCSLEYSTDAITEKFYFAVLNGTQNTFYPLYFGEEICLFVRCNAADGKECVTFPMWSQDIFHHMNITANFSTPYIYPSVVNDHFRLYPYSDWNYSTKKIKHTYQANLNFNSKKGQPLLLAGLNGRVYREDPRPSFF